MYIQPLEQLYHTATYAYLNVANNLHIDPLILSQNLAPQYQEPSGLSPLEIALGIGGGVAVIAFIIGGLATKGRENLANPKRITDQYGDRINKPKKPNQP
ncbi:hypothetical protein HN789_05365 [archaeon]|jgi:hypothetical protein|nr:hypothetical protein [archaeon]MBT4022941.1 hypothetical protein [archaeon]MBT4271932.1 hypothetical protein [archaeon]MBT5424100.1 hypothetical protein [archaeon]MBT6772670.1 hypothetical protein [archaeon]